MIRLKLTDQESADIAEALDDPTTTEKNKTKLLVIRMHHEGAKHGFIAKVLNLHANTITTSRSIPKADSPALSKIDTTAPAVHWNPLLNA
jgi:hypothetical protein